MTPLDRSSSKPLWSQLEFDLRRRLKEGDFDTRFPTDLELTRRYEVSRHTVREAVAALGRDGLVSRVRGRGTMVEQGKFKQRLGALYSLFAEVESTGVPQTSEVLRIDIAPEPAVAQRLELAEDSDIFRLDRLRRAEGIPLAVDQVWLPADLARPLADADFSHTALYDELEKRCGFRPDNGWEHITPIVPSESTRRDLDMPADGAAFRVERLGRYGDRVVEWRVTIIRGDRYSFFADWASDAVVNSGLRLGRNR